MSKMNFDKTTIVVVAISAVLLLSWNTIFGPKGLDLLPKTQPQEQVEQVHESVPKESVNPETVKETQKVVEQNVTANEVKTSVNTASLEEWNKKFPIVKLISPDSLFEMSIDPVKGDVASVTLNKIFTANNEKTVVLGNNITPGALAVATPPDSFQWKLLDVKPPVKTNDTLLVSRNFDIGNGQQISLTQKWVLDKNYTTKYDVDIKNISSNNLNIRNLYFYAGAIPSVKYVSGDIIRIESHSIDALLTDNKLYTLKAGSSSFQKEPVQYSPIQWLAASDGYYAFILKAAENTDISAGNYSFSEVKSVKNEKGKNESYDVIGAAARIQSINLQPNEQKSWNFDFYAGPKDIKMLKGFSPKAGEILHLMSWPVFRTLTEWFLTALIWLNGVCGNLGVAIIILTIIVKLIFWPITHKSNKSMKRMQHIQPKVKELREMYKDNKQKLNQATMELYKKEKVNPLGGCLPILIQIPVFIALYYTLSGTFEIRHSSFLWASNLAQPDTVGHIFGLAINPFAIMMALSMLLQQKMMPTAADPAQAKMMMIMPVVMLFFLYDLPSGLTLYWTVSQIFTIVQLLYNKYTDKEDEPGKNNNNMNNTKSNKKLKRA